MKKDNFFTEEMNQTNNGNLNGTALDLFIQMVIDEALFKRKKFLLEEEINQALESKNKELFFELSQKYRELSKYSTA